MILAVSASSCFDSGPGSGPDPSKGGSFSTAVQEETPVYKELPPEIEEEPVFREVSEDDLEKPIVESVDLEQIIGAEDKILVPKANSFESELPTGSKLYPAGPSAAYEAPTITGDAGKQYYNSSFDVQLAGAAGESLSYLLIDRDAAGSLHCHNGIAAAAGENVTIPAGSVSGEVKYFYVVSCDIYDNISPETSRTYTYDAIAPQVPIASAMSQYFNTDFSLSLSVDSSNALAPEFIMYTTDGSELGSCSDGILYSHPLTINATTTLKAIACDQAGNQSSQISHTYTKDTTPPAAPGISGAAGKEYYKQDFNIQLSTGGIGEQLRYILQTTPAANTLTCKNGKTLLPGTDIRISSTTQGEVQYLYAVSCDFAGNHSAELSRSFTYDSIVPNTPRTSEYRQFFNTDFTITLSLDTPDVVAPERIKYTTDGSILASCTDGALYSSPININATMIIRAIACDQAGNISGE